MDDEYSGEGYARLSDSEFRLIKKALKNYPPSTTTKRLIRKIDTLLKDPDEEGGYIAVELEEGKDNLSGSKGEE